MILIVDFLVGVVALLIIVAVLYLVLGLDVVSLIKKLKKRHSKISKTYDKIK